MSPFLSAQMGITKGCMIFQNVDCLQLASFWIPMSQVDQKKKRQIKNQQPNTERHFEDRGLGDQKNNQSLNSSGKNARMQIALFIRLAFAWFQCLLTKKEKYVENLFGTLRLFSSAYHLSDLFLSWFFFVCGLFFFLFSDIQLIIKDIKGKALLRTLVILVVGNYVNQKCKSLRSLKRSNNLFYFSEEK